MCRNIGPIFNFEPPVTKEEIRAAEIATARTRAALRFQK